MYPIEIESQIQIIKSKGIASSVINKLQLMKNYLGFAYKGARIRLRK